MDEVPVQAAELKPMSLSELLDRTFTLYRNRFWLFCGIMVIPEIAIMICSLIVVVGFPIHVLPIAQSSQDPFAIFRTMQSRIVPSFLLIIAQLFFQALALGAVTVAVSELYLGRAVTIRGAYRMIRGKIFGLIGLIILLFLIAFVFLVGIFVAVGLVGGLASVALTAISPILSVIVILLMAAGGFVLAAWLLMRFAVSIPVFLLEQQGAVESMARSGVLTRGNRGRILGAVLVMYIVSFVVQSLFVMPFAILAFLYAAKGLLPTWIQAGQSVTAAIAGTVAGPLFMITIALIYYDVRIRKEAFDLESMMNALNVSTTAGGDAGAPPPLQPAS
jgi:Membrane domain of glycerophosphoryl diester phosphodiesterase